MTMCRSPSRTPVSGSRSSLLSPLPAATAADETSVVKSSSSAAEAADIHVSDDEDDAGSSAVPQVMVGPDGNIILNPGR